MQDTKFLVFAFVHLLRFCRENKQQDALMLGRRVLNKLKDSNDKEILLTEIKQWPVNKLSILRKEN